jgi:hypothetical protein
MPKHYSVQRAKQAIEIKLRYFCTFPKTVDVIFALTAIIPAVMVADELRRGLSAEFPHPSAV